MKIPFRGDLRQLNRVEVELGHSSNVVAGRLLLQSDPDEVGGSRIKSGQWRKMPLSAPAMAALAELSGCQSCGCRRESSPPSAHFLRAQGDCRRATSRKCLKYGDPGPIRTGDLPLRRENHVILKPKPCKALGAKVSIAVALLWRAA